MCACVRVSLSISATLSLGLCLSLSLLVFLARFLALQSIYFVFNTLRKFSVCVSPMDATCCRGDNRNPATGFLCFQACAMESSKRATSQEYTFEFVRTNGKCIRAHCLQQPYRYPLYTDARYHTVTVLLALLAHAITTNTPYGIAFVMQHVDLADLKSSNRACTRRS